MTQPNVQDLGKKIMPTVLSFKLTAGTSPHGLFDGTQVNEWNTTRVAYWGTAGDFVEIEIPAKCNIWRSGTESWATSNGQLQIKKWNGSSYDNVTTQYSLPTTAITHEQWGKFVVDLPKGRYRFEVGSARLDSEWYVESIVISKHLIKSSNKIQVLNDDVWVDTFLSEPLSKVDFETHGMDDLNAIVDKLEDLEDAEFEVITWTDEEATKSTLDYSYDQYEPKWLELDTDPFSPMDKLNQEEEFEVITYSDENEVLPKQNTSIQETVDSGKLFKTTLEDFVNIIGVEVV